MKRFKLVVPSFVALIFCALLMLGSTFALFTSQDQASIAVTSGKVEVTATMNLDNTFSAKAVSDSEYASSTSKAGQILTGDFAGNYVYDQQENFAFVNGGGAALANNEIVITKMTPGDKVEAHLDLKNKSNVNIKYRLRINALEKDDATDSLDLLEELVVMVGTRKISVVNTVDDWTNLLAGNDFVDLDIVIYLPLESGNDYQGLTTGLLFTLEAVQGNAATDNTLEAINAVLNGSDGKNATMYDAFQELATANYDFATVSKYVWNSKTDLFYNENTVLGFENQYFKVYNAMPETQTFSIYAGSNWNTAEINNLTVGFDAGNATGITSISYDRHEATSARESVIRTNGEGTSLTINAPLDTVHHYGTAGTVNVVAVAGNSLHVNGKVNFLQISKGRVALETAAQVEQVHINAKVENNVKKDEFDEIVIAVKQITKPEFSRDDVEIASTGTLVVALEREVETSETEIETVLDYVWLTKQGIFEQIKVSESNDAEKLNSAKWADDESVVEKTQDAAQQIANNIGRNTSTQKVEAEVTLGTGTEQQTYTVTLDETTRELIVTDSNNNEVEEASAVVEEAIENTGLTAEEKEILINNATLFAGGDGTKNNPYIIENRKQLENISKVNANYVSEYDYASDLYYGNINTLENTSLAGNWSECVNYVYGDNDNYEKAAKANGWTTEVIGGYFKVADGVKTIDCSNWTSGILYGHFDGNGVTLNNLNNALFNTVSYFSSDEVDYEVSTIANLTANVNIKSTSRYFEAFITNLDWSIKFKNVTLHGYIEAQNTASFVGLGIGYSGSNDGDAITISFDNCYSDVNLVAVGGLASGFVAHPYWGKGSSMIINDSIYCGNATSISGNKYYKGNASNDSYTTLEETYSDGFFAQYGLESIEDLRGATKTWGASYALTQKSAHLTVKNDLTRPELGQAFVVSQEEGAVKAVAKFIVGPNDVNEKGNYTGIYLIDNELTAENGTFTTQNVKYYTVTVNGSSTEETGISGTNLNIVSGGYGTTYHTYMVEIVQYDANGNIVSINRCDLH